VFRHLVGLALIPAVALAGVPASAQVVCASGGCQIGPCGCYDINKIADNTFESTTCINWVFSAGASREAKSSFCHNGHDGLLEEDGVHGSQAIYQDVVLPATLIHGAGVSSGELDFTLDIQTLETVSYDSLTVDPEPGDQCGAPDAHDDSKHLLCVLPVRVHLFDPQRDLFAEPDDPSLFPGQLQR
jgi:hypothetical protein